MTYAILRTAKLKTFGEIGGSIAHTLRTRETPNADAQRTPSNEHHGPSTAAEIVQGIRERLPEKRRSDAVLCIEYFIGASPEFFTQDDGAAYFAAARAWLVERHGAANVISAHVHRDETSPHLVAYVVPRDGEKLNAKKWLGGKAVLSAMQTDFAERVGRAYGLERGIEGSVATHQTIREYYALAQQAERAAPKLEYPKERAVLEKGVLTSTVETDAAFAERVAGAVREQMLPAAQKGLQAVQSGRREREQARQVGRLQKALQAAQERLAGFERLFEGLTPDQASELVKAAERAADQMRQAAKGVVGWFKGMTQKVRGGEYTVTVQRQDNGQLVEIENTRAAVDLHQAGVKPGDLVRIHAGGAELLERVQSRGPER